MAKISRRQRNSSVQKQNHEFSVRPLTKAVRVALAVSVSALALTMAPRPAKAANPGAPWCTYNAVSNTEYCNGFSMSETLTHGFVGTPDDLTMVVGNSSNTNIVNPPWWAPDGIDATWNGDVRVELGSFGYIHAYDGEGIVASTNPTFAGFYDATVINSGTIHTGGLIGIDVYASENAAVVNYGWAEGVSVTAQDGTASVHNDGTGDVFQSWGYYGAEATAIEATAWYSDAYIRNDGNADATAWTGSSGGATGLSAWADDDATVLNFGATAVWADGFALGIDAGALDYVRVVNDGSVYVRSDGDATGISASSAFDEASVYNSGSIDVQSDWGDARGIDAEGESVDIFNRSGGTIDVWGYDYAYGIDAHGSDWTSTIVNAGLINVDANWDDAYGIRASTDSGDIFITNRATGTIDVNSNDNDAYGIYVTGHGGTISVANRGNINVDGEEYASGIEVNSYDGSDVSVSNNADISVDAYFDTAYGIEVDAYDNGTVVVTNNHGGTITAHSRYGDAYGIYVDQRDYGDVEVQNNGTVSATAYSDNGDAYGIAVWADKGGEVTIANSGTVTATAADGGEGNPADDATGIFVATGYHDGEWNYNGGDITIFNTGDVLADSYNQNAYGVNVEMEAGGYAFIQNDGSIGAQADVGDATGINVNAKYYNDYTENDYFGDVTLVNTGDVYADTLLGNAYAVLIEGGKVIVDNQGAIGADAPLDNGQAVGVFAFGADSVDFDNSGRIDVRADGGEGVSFVFGGSANGVGLIAGGDVTAENSGRVNVESSAGDALGIGAASLYGDVSIINTATGRIDVEAGWLAYGSAIGIVGYGVMGDVTIDNAGEVVVLAEDNATGLLGQTSKYGDIGITNSGLVDVRAYDTVVGISAYSEGGDISITNGATGHIDVESYWNDATGIEAVSTNGGSIAIDNAGEIWVQADDNAAGIVARTNGDGTIDINNNGLVDVGTHDNAVGIGAYAQFGHVYVTNDVDGEINVDSYSGRAVGIDASNVGGGFNPTLAIGAGVPAHSGDIEVVNYGSIDVWADDGFGYGIRAVSTYGDVRVGNVDTVDPVTDELLYSADIAVWSNWDAFGISAASTGEWTNRGFDDLDGTHFLGTYETAGGNVFVFNDTYSSIEVDTQGWGEGIAAYSNGGEIVVANLGSIDVWSGNEQAFGISAHADSLSTDFGFIGETYGTRDYGEMTTAGGNVYVYTGDDSSIVVYADHQAYGIKIEAEGGDVGVYAGGSIDVENRWGGANGISVDATNTNRDFGSYWTIDGPVSNGFELYASGDVYIATDDGATIDVFARYDAYGIEVSADGGDIEIHNAADISVGSLWRDATGIDAWSNGSSDYVAGDVFVGNSGDIAVSTVQYVDGEGWYTGYDATGISAGSNGGDVEVRNSGNIDVVAFVNDDGDWFYDYNADAMGIAATSWNDGTVTVTNTGHISAVAYYHATGISADAEDGDVTVTNSATGSIHVLQTGWDGDVHDYGAYGINAYTDGTGDITVNNAGSIDVWGEYNAYGISAWATGDGDITVNNASTSHIDVYSADANAYGIAAWATYDYDGLTTGSVTVHNAGEIIVENDDSWQGATGIHAEAELGDVLVTHSGSITVDSNSWAEGIAAETFGVIDGGEGLTGGGDITVSTAEDSTILARTSNYGGGTAVGIRVNTNSGAVTVSNAGDIQALSPRGRTYGINVYSGDGNEDFGGYWDGGFYHDLGSIDHGSGDVSVTNTATGSIVAQGEDEARGINVRTNGGDATIVNNGSIGAYSDDSSAQGIAVDAFANYADFGAYQYSYDGYTYWHDNGGQWYSSGDVTISTGADSTIDAEAWNRAWGIDVITRGGDITIVNAGDMTVQSKDDNAYGIQAHSSGGMDYGAGDVSVNNSGNIVVTNVYFDGSWHYGSFLAGIDAGSDGGNVSVTNSGSIDAQGYVYEDSVGEWDAGDHAVGIEAHSSGDGTVTVTNSGSIHASGYEDAIGIEAMAQDGDVLVTNTAGSHIDVWQMGEYWWDTNYAFGIKAVTGGEGDVTVHNAGEIYVDTEYFGVGIDASADGSGDVEVISAATGNINVDTWDQEAYGVRADANYGNTYVRNDGSIYAYSEWDRAYGISAEAWGVSGDPEITVGEVTVVNTGDITARAWDDDGYGIQVMGSDDLTVYNSGSIDSQAYGDAYGIDADTDGMSGDVRVTNSAAGTIFALTWGDDGYDATGIQVNANDGLVSVLNAGDITAVAYDDGAYGIDVNSDEGDITASNTGTIRALSVYYSESEETTYVGNDARGIDAWSWSGDITVTNTGSIEAVAYSYNDVTENGYRGDDAWGIAAFSEFGDVFVGNSGHITATSYYYAYGIIAESVYGSVTVVNTDTGVITAEQTGWDDWDEYTAYGIRARTLVDGDITVNNAGSITAIGEYYAYGVYADAHDGNVTVHSAATGVIDAYAYEGDAYGIGAWSDYGDVIVTNAGAISAESRWSDATGIDAWSWDGDVAVLNDTTGHIDAYADDDAIGIDANAYHGDVRVDNFGVIHAGDAWFSAGIDASSRYGSVIAVNTGTIGVDSYGDGEGISASSDGSFVFVLNEYDGTIAVTANDDATGVDAFSGGVSAAVLNYGAIDVWAEGGGGFALGVRAYSQYGDVTVGNLNVIDPETQELLSESFITATSDHGDASGIEAGTHGGHVSILNEGTITVAASATYADYAYAHGIDAYAYDYYNGSEETWYIGEVDIANTGTVGVDSGYVATGIEGHTGQGSLRIENGEYGSVDVAGVEDAYGISAYTDNGNIEVLNYGSVSVVSDEGDAYGIYADAGEASNGDSTFDILIANDATGSVTVTSYDDAYGVYATGNNADIGVFNAGSIDVTSGGSATGVFAGSGSGDVVVISDGTIAATSYGDATGIRGESFDGNVVAFNGGAITADGGEGHSFGIDAYSKYGSVLVGNTYEGGPTRTLVGGDDVATIDVTAAYGDATGINAGSKYGTVDVINDGDITATGYAAYGIEARSEFDDVYVGNTGTVVASATDHTAIGISANSGGEYYNSETAETYYVSGNAVIINEGDVTAIAADGGEYGGAAGLGAYVNGDGTAYVGNSGNVHATSAKYAIGVASISSYGDALVRTTGDITASGTNPEGALAIGVYASGYDFAYLGVGSEATIDANALSSAGHAFAIGAIVGSYGDAVIVNEGTIRATATGGTSDVAEAMGVRVSTNSGEGDITVINAGTIRATATAETGIAAAVVLDGDYGSYVYNGGTIIATGNYQSIAIVSSGYSDDEIVNLGTMTGSILAGDGDDSLFNDGTWHALQASDFGAGDDIVHNGVHGVIWMDNSSISMGGWGSEAGGGGGLQAVTPSGNQFVNDGTIHVLGDSTIDMGDGNPNPFTNNGTIDFTDDGLPNDTLTILGDLAGDGVLLVDMTGLNGATDVLYVDGDVVDGTTMHISGHLDTMPTSASTRFDILQVSGTSAVGQLVLDSLTTNDDSFVTFQIGTEETINSGNTAPDMHSLVIEVTGLSPRGDALSALAPAMQNYWHDSVGSLTRRTGVAEGQELGMPTAWVRMMQSDETVKPDLGGRNFGPGGNSRFDQSNTGMEFGVDVGLTDNLRLGVLASKGDASIHMNGVGSAKIKADSYGGYVTWLGDNGLYVDATYRKMDFTTEVKADGFKDKPDASADGYSLEAGYAWKLASGLVLKPELQYSQMSVKKFDVTDNSYGTFDLKDGDSTRLRAGLTVQKTLGEKGKTWTPYAGAYYVNEMDGKGTFGINGNFQGDVDLGGNSMLLEGGVTGQVGNWVLTGGLNWQNGGAISSALGGQLSVRYSF